MRSFSQIKKEEKSLIFLFFLLSFYSIIFLLWKKYQFQSLIFNVKNLLRLVIFFIHYYVIHSTIFYILLCYVMEDKITTQMKKGVLEYIILAIIAKWEVYASDIITTLKEHNLLLVEGTLYPLLSRLKTEELLSYSRVESPQWPPRKYYRLSQKGEWALEIMRNTRKGLADTVKSVDH